MASTHAQAHHHSGPFLPAFPSNVLPQTSTLLGGVHGAAPEWAWERRGQQERVDAKRDLQNRMFLHTNTVAGLPDVVKDPSRPQVDYEQELKAQRDSERRAWKRERKVRQIAGPPETESPHRREVNTRLTVAQPGRSSSAHHRRATSESNPPPASPRSTRSGATWTEDSDSKLPPYPHQQPFQKSRNNSKSAVHRTSSGSSDQPPYTLQTIPTPASERASQPLPIPVAGEGDVDYPVHIHYHMPQVDYPSVSDAGRPASEYVLPANKPERSRSKPVRADPPPPTAPRPDAGRSKRVDSRPHPKTSPEPSPLPDETGEYQAQWRTVLARKLTSTHAPSGGPNLHDEFGFGFEKRTTEWVEQHWSMRFLSVTTPTASTIDLDTPESVISEAPLMPEQVRPDGRRHEGRRQLEERRREREDWRRQEEQQREDQIRQQAEQHQDEEQRQEKEQRQEEEQRREEDRRRQDEEKHRHTERASPQPQGLSRDVPIVSLPTRRSSQALRSLANRQSMASKRASTILTKRQSIRTEDLERISDDFENVSSTSSEVDFEPYQQEDDSVAEERMWAVDAAARVDAKRHREVEIDFARGSEPNRRRQAQPPAPTPATARVEQFPPHSRPEETQEPPLLLRRSSGSGIFQRRSLFRHSTALLHPTTEDSASSFRDKESFRDSYGDSLKEKAQEKERIPSGEYSSEADYGVEISRLRPSPPPLQPGVQENLDQDHIFAEDMRQLSPPNARRLKRNTFGTFDEQPLRTYRTSATASSSASPPPGSHAQPQVPEKKPTGWRKPPNYPDAAAQPQPHQQEQPQQYSHSKPLARNIRVQQIGPGGSRTSPPETRERPPNGQARELRGSDISSSTATTDIHRPYRAAHAQLNEEFLSLVKGKPWPPPDSQEEDEGTSTIKGENDDDEDYDDEEEEGRDYLGQDIEFGNRGSLSVIEEDPLRERESFATTDSMIFAPNQATDSYSDFREQAYGRGHRRR